MTSKTKEIFEEGNWTMLKGFKKSVDVDFTVSKNRVKMEKAFKQIEKEIGQVYPLIIGGKRIETEKKITSLNPATKEVLAMPAVVVKNLQTKRSKQHRKHLRLGV